MKPENNQPLDPAKFISSPEFNLKPQPRALESRPRGVTHWPLVLDQSFQILGHMPREYLDKLRPEDQIYMLVKEQVAAKFWHINWIKIENKLCPVYFAMPATESGQLLTYPDGHVLPMEAEPNKNLELEILTTWAGIGMRIWGTVKRKALLTRMKELMLN